MAFIHIIEAILNILLQLCVIFPYNALTIRRPSHFQPFRANIEKQTRPGLPSVRSNTIMISDKVYKLCTSPETVSSLLAKDPTLAPGEAWKKLYGGHTVGEKEGNGAARARRDQATLEDLKRAAECGKWGTTEPSELFLRVSFFRYRRFIFFPPGLIPISRYTMTPSVLLTIMSRGLWLVRH